MVQKYKLMEGTSGFKLCPFLCMYTVYPHTKKVAASAILLPLKALLIFKMVSPRRIFLAGGGRLQPYQPQSNTTKLIFTAIWIFGIGVHVFKVESWNNFRKLRKQKGLVLAEDHLINKNKIIFSHMFDLHIFTCYTYSTYI